MNAPALLKQTPLREVKDVRALLMNQQARDQLAMVAAKHMNPERMMRVVANAIRTTPKLQECEPMSFLGALMQCAALGLEPNTILGHAYMIPFENRRKNVTEVQVVVGYKGLIDLARRSGHITSLSANIHRADDDLWDYEEGTDARLRHRPGAQRGQKLHAYAIAKFKDGGHAFVVLPWEHVMSIRDASQGYQTAKRFNKLADSPWVKHEDEMAKKTAVRALSKYLPLSIEFMDAVSMEEGGADFRGFAMDPAQGLAVGEPGEVIDGETGEVSQAAQETPMVEDARATQVVAERKPVREVAQSATAEAGGAPEPRKAASPRQDDATRAVDQKSLLPDDSIPEAYAGGQRGADPAQFQGLFDLIMSEVQTGTPAADIEDMYGPQLQQMRASFPDMAARIAAAMNNGAR